MFSKKNEKKKNCRLCKNPPLGTIVLQPAISETLIYSNKSKKKKKQKYYCGLMKFECYLHVMNMPYFAFKVAFGCYICYECLFLNA